MSKKTILSVAIFLFFLNFICWREVFALSAERYLTVNFLDVGQGDAAFIETPQGHQIIIDGGPGNTLLSKLAYLMPAWDKDVDLVILSHPEKDHMQGLLSALQSYKADYILWSGIKRETSEYNAWADVLLKQKEMGSKILIAESGLEMEAGNVLIDTLYPAENLSGKEIKNTSNDTGVVSKIIYGENSFLFTGDIGMAAEREIIELKKDISADVLKVAHHGSKYSTSDAFLAAVLPKLAAIEVGKNSYGHPTQEVLQRLANFGIQTLRTDQNGDITILSDGNNIYIK